jgi:hypothetical protein
MRSGNKVACLRSSPSIKPLIVHTLTAKHNYKR